MARKKAINPDQKRLVVIRWRDHTSRDGWIELKDLPEELKWAEMVSIGWLVHEDGDAYYLAGTMSQTDKSVGDSRCILKGAVIKVTDIQP